MYFKYETHLHTAEVSRCAVDDGERMAKAFHSEGYTGIIVTDHFFNGNIEIDRGLDWETKINLFCKGYENAKKAGDKIGLDVFFGWEYNYKGTEFLTYGLDKKWLMDNPDVMEWSLAEYVKKVRKCGGFLVHAHPFREASYIKKVRLYPKYADAIETINTHNQDPLYNIRAAEYARKLGLPKTSGTDAHDVAPNKFGGMLFKRRLKDIEDFIQAVKSEEYKLLGE